MKKYSTLILLLTLFSCVEDLDLPYEKSDGKVVVNCLFTPDKAWKVMLTRIKPYTDSSFTLVEDAKVAIVAQNKDTVYLHYQSNGIYTSVEKPLTGIPYELIIKTNNSEIIKAKSMIPASPVISSLNYIDQKTMYFFNANITNYESYLLNLQITGVEPQNFVCFRFYSFNTERGYLRYTVTNETITELREQNFKENILSELEELINISMGSDQKYSLIGRIVKKYNIPWTQENKIHAALTETKIKYRSEDAFRSQYLFSNNNWLNNVSRDTYNVFGEYANNHDVTLFVSSQPADNKNEDLDYTEEYWLEVVGMSEDYYKYQRSAIKQAVNKDNPFASFVEVHSNIENGVGIFAGYNKQMIHFYDY